MVAAGPIASPASSIMQPSMFDTLRADPMIIILAIGVAAILVAFYRAHRRAGFDFNAFDLVMEDGKVNKIAVAFMLVLLVTTWVIIDQQLKGNLSEGMFGLYGGMWVIPLVAKVVFQKTEMPGTTTMSSMTSTTTVPAQEPLP